MENINFNKFNLSEEESRYLAKSLAEKRNVSNYEQMTDQNLINILENKTEKQKNNPKQQIISKNKERIEIIRSELKELGYKLLRDEFKEIKRSLYRVENKRFIRIKKPTKYLDELDEKIRKLDKYYHDDDFEFRGIRNILDLFKSSIDEDYYKPTLVKSGYNSNYTQ